MEILRESNRGMENILSTLKVPQTKVVNLVKPIKHLFEELMSKLFIVLLPHDLNKFNLEIKLSGSRILYSFLMNSLTKKKERNQCLHP